MLINKGEVFKKKILRCSIWQRNTCRMLSMSQHWENRCFQCTWIVERVWDMDNDRVLTWTHVKHYSNTPYVCVWDGMDAREAYYSHPKCIRHHIYYRVKFYMYLWDLSCWILLQYCLVAIRLHGDILSLVEVIDFPLRYQTFTLYLTLVDLTIDCWKP